jgi:hypothetical protein
MLFPVLCHKCHRSEAIARWITNDFRCVECSTILTPDRSPYERGERFDTVFDLLCEGDTLEELAKRMSRLIGIRSQTCYEYVGDAVADLRNKGYQVTGTKDHEIRKLILDQSARDRLGERGEYKWKSRRK